MQEYGYSESLRHGGVEHLYWLRKIKEKLVCQGYKVEEEYPIGKGQTVDLAIIGKKRIAIEIETGKSDAIHNIEKCLNANFDVISAATNPDTLQKIISELNQLPEPARQRVRVIAA